jgi:hypothetical protein
MEAPSQRARVLAEARRRVVSSGFREDWVEERRAGGEWTKKHRDAGPQGSAQRSKGAGE